MYRIISYVLLSFFLPTALPAQQYVAEGKIEFERKSNQHAFLNDGNVIDDLMKKEMPKFVTYYYDLVFKGDRTLYKTGREPDVKQIKYWGLLSSENTIYTRLDSNSAVTMREIHGDRSLVTDSLRNIEWKITTEIRKIAGFDCRKAVGRIMDSIVVIAFYTDDILTSGGPESINGLPGMILGVAIPRLHTTWYATKLQLVPVTEKDLVIPKKGKPMTGTEYRTFIDETLKDWGSEGKKRKFQYLL